MDGIQELRKLIRDLRGDHGCPWDKKQTIASMARYLTEEAGEAVEAISEQNDSGVCEELGDVLLIIVMISQIAEEEGKFSFDDVVAGINEKIVRRHPHVFGDMKLDTAEQVLLNWNKIKEQEKRAGENG